MSEIFDFIAAECAETTLTITTMCRLLGVSTSGYYDHQKARVSARAARRELVTSHVRAAFNVGRGAYGVRRVHALLRRSDDPQVRSASLDLVRSIMAAEGLVACQPRAYRVTTQQGDRAADIPDLVNRDFTAPAPGRVFVGDITYIRTAMGWLYLATVIDVFTRQVVGWSMATHMRASLICDALTMAATNTTVAPKAVFHSDRGAQGGFKWSSQHPLTWEVLHGASSAGGGSGGPAEVAVAGASEVSASCGGGVLGADRRGSASGGGQRRRWRGASSGCPVVPQRWGHAAVRYQTQAQRRLLVLC